MGEYDILRSIYSSQFYNTGDLTKRQHIFQQKRKRMETEDTTGTPAALPIQAVKVQDVWDYIRPAIDKIIEALPWRDFRAEDVYSSCSAGESVVFIDPAVQVGESFFVARMVEDPYTKESTMVLWISHSSTPETASRVMDSIDTIAQNSGCSHIEFTTGSKKLVEYGKAHGFDKVMYEVRKAVTPRIPQGGE